MKVRRIVTALLLAVGVASLAAQSSIEIGPLLWMDMSAPVARLRTGAFHVEPPRTHTHGAIAVWVRLSIWSRAAE